MLVLCTFFLLLSRKPLIVFYGLPKSVVAAIEKEAGNDFAFSVIDDDKSLSAHKRDLVRGQLVFMYDGKPAKEIGEQSIAPESKLFSLMPSAMRESGKFGAKQYGIPVLYDHFGIDWNIALLGHKGIAKPNTLTELVKTATAIKGKNLWPIVCAGGNDNDLLMFTGALVIAESGLGAYEKVVQTAASGKTFANLLATTALKKSLDTLVAWRKQGIIHPEWFRMKRADMYAFMQYDYACFFALSLSVHRQIAPKTVEKLGSIEFPTDSKEVNRGIMAPAIIAIELKHALPGHTAARKLVNKLVQAEGQAALANDSGLAPSNSNSVVPDKQADDARFWIASSMKAMPDPAQAAFENPADRTAFANAIRQYLIADGVIN